MLILIYITEIACQLLRKHAFDKEIVALCMSLSFLSEKPYTENHLYSWGSMFIGSQNYSGSRGHNFVSSVTKIILTNIKQILVHVHSSWGCKFVGSV